METARRSYQKPVGISPQRVVILLLAIGFLFRCVIAFWLFPGFDESYYYLYSQHLDWSYFDHPPLVALTAGLGIWLTGEVTQFTIRWGTLLLYTGSLWLLYLTSRHLFGTQAALLTLTIATIAPGFQIVFGILTLPDGPLIFFWTASLYCAVKEFFPPSRAYYPTYRLALLGVLVGLAVLSKYHGFILGLGLLLFCVTLPPYRVIFRSFWTLWSVFLFLVTLFPIWFWNFQHDWLSFRFQLFSRFSPETGFVTFNGLNVLLAALVTVGYLFPPLGIPFWWVMGRSLSAQVPTFFSAKAFSTRTELADKQWFLLCTSLPLILIFLTVSGLQIIFPTWLLPGLWGITLLLGQKATQWPARQVRRWLQVSGIGTVSLLCLILLHINSGIFQKPSHYQLLPQVIPVQNDPSRELVDIQQLRQKFVNSPLLSEALAKAQFVFTNGYAFVGHIAMALQPLTSLPITCLCLDNRGFSIWFDSQEWIGKDALYIVLDQYARMPKLTEEYSSYFQGFQKIATVPIQRGGEVIEVFHVYQGKNFLRPYEPISYPETR